MNRMNSEEMQTRRDEIVCSWKPDRGPAVLREVFEACRDILAGLSEDDLPEDWIDYCCVWLQHEYFPDQAAPEKQEERAEAMRFFLDVLDGIFIRERQELPFDPCRDFEVLSREELTMTDVRREYRILLNCLADEHVYAFMRLARECTPFDTLGHIAGVHHVAMHLARQLLHTDVKVDPGLISGAAIAHDIGKFGCRPEEVRRVPYLHYYYSWQYCERHHLKEIGSIASNHSVWDLELENLSVESLLLIYADFRVKSTRENGHEKVCFWSLAESYQIILDKLDNVDEKKRDRYARVYAKLADFEEFLISVGCSTDLEKGWQEPPAKKAAAVMSREEIIREFRLLAIRANLEVMFHTSHEMRFIDLLETIRSEKNWTHLRAYLTVMGEYSIYLRQEQKDIILQFLFDMLSHREGDIRRQAARITGKLIANYEIHFAKEIPAGMKTPKIGKRMTEVWKNFLHRMLFPGNMVSEQHRRWIGFSLKRVFSCLLDYSDTEQRKGVLRIFINNYKSTQWQDVTCFLLLDCLTVVPFDLCNDPQKKLLYRYARHFTDSENAEIRAAAFCFLLHALETGQEADDEVRADMDRILQEKASDPVCIRYLIFRIRRRLRREMAAAAPETGGEALRDASFTCSIPALYMENQRAEIPWIFKQTNMQILKEHFLEQSDRDGIYQYAAHLLHLLQFADRIVNKLQAGRDLTDCVAVLSEAQQYEIVLELVRGMEMGEYAVSWYIPRFLGRMYLLLPKERRISLLDHFRELLGLRNERVIIITLETLGAILHHIPAEELRQGGGFRGEVSRIEGMLCSGLVHYDPEVVEEALYIVGHAVFGYENSEESQKTMYFADLCRKILTSMNPDGMGVYTFYHAAALNHIYRFLAEFRHRGGALPAEPAQKIAFFPGTFDPFSLGHKAIVREIAGMGFRVYLAVDEFSWSKRTQPWYIRRKIVEMSIADIQEAYLFPEDLPVNIANPGDLRALSELFGDEELYLVAGSDVIEFASAYRKPREPWSVHSFPHILFARNTDRDFESSSAKQLLDKEVLWLKLPAYYENMSSTRIRENVGGRKDITNLVEKTVQNYIYDSSLYVMEPIYKRTARTLETETVFYEKITPSLEKELREAGLLTEAAAPQDQAAVLLEEGMPAGAVFFHPAGVAEFYSSCADLGMADRLREKMSGKNVVISGLAGRKTDSNDNARQVLNELLAVCQEKGYSHAVCFRADDWQELLEMQGFLQFPGLKSCMTVRLTRPVVMVCDTISYLKEPFADLPSMQHVIWECRKKLQKAVAGLYPGELILSFDAESLNYRIIRTIQKNNTFPEVQYTSKKLAEGMCVPFGKTMKDVIVPECVTKSLYTEKLYSMDAARFEIREFPQYAPLSIQIRTIRSFGRPVILVDDFFHKGFRMKEINACLQKEGMKADRLVVGVMSGRGRDLAAAEGLPVESVYFVPNMHVWFVESDLYPFIGGDGIQTGETRGAGHEALPSINAILPYQVPGYLEGASMEAFFQMSRVCFENAAAICRQLETEYQRLYGRKLTMARISEAMAEPRHPDSAVLNEETLQMSPSVLISGELRKLSRQRHLLDGKFRM